MLAILAGTAATFTDAAIDGDVAVSPGTELTRTRSTISGAQHVNDATAEAARDEFDDLFSELAKTPRGRVLSGTLDGVKLPPGVYEFAAAATLTGTLILEGLGLYLFRVGAALTATGFRVALTGGAQVSGVTWRAEAGVTLTDSEMSGRVLAGAAATITRGKLHGELWAREAVEITGAAVEA